MVTIRRIAGVLSVWCMISNCMEKIPIRGNVIENRAYLHAAVAHMTGGFCREHGARESIFSRLLYRWCNNEMWLLTRNARYDLLRGKFSTYGFYMQHASFIESYLHLTCPTISQGPRAHEYHMGACAHMVKLIDKLEALIFEYPQYRSIGAYLENFLTEHVCSDDVIAQCLYAEFAEKIKLRGFDSVFTSDQLITHIATHHSKQECLELMRLYGTRAWYSVARCGNRMIEDLLKEYACRYPTDILSERCNLLISSSS